MATPPNEGLLHNNVELRIPLTVEQEQCVVEAAALAQSDIATWLRPIILQAARDALAVHELRQRTPGNEELRKLARDNPPSPEWFEGDVEQPF